MDSSNQPTLQPRTKKKAKRAKRPDRTVTFKDVHGNRMNLPGSLTLKQLIQLGVMRVGIVKPDAPMEVNEWRSVGLLPSKIREGKK